MKQKYAVTSPERFEKIFEENRWFDCANPEQHTKLFLLNKEADCPIDRIALFIWFNSSDAEFDDIMNKLTAEKKSYEQSAGKIYSSVEDVLDDVDEIIDIVYEIRAATKEMQKALTDVSDLSRYIDGQIDDVAGKATAILENGAE